MRTSIHYVIKKMTNSQQRDVDMKKSNMLVQYFSLNIFQRERERFQCYCKNYSSHSLTTTLSSFLKNLFWKDEL